MPFSKASKQKEPDLTWTSMVKLNCKIWTYSMLVPHITNTVTVTLQQLCNYELPFTSRSQSVQNDLQWYSAKHGNRRNQVWHELQQWNSTSWQQSYYLDYEFPFASKKPVNPERSTVRFDSQDTFIHTNKQTQHAMPKSSVLPPDSGILAGFYTLET
jgi:hypothetical protein